MIIGVIVLIAFIFLYSLSNTIYGGDSGDLLSAILTKGHAHPPGYSLYTLLGIIFNKLPLHLTPAGKITLISSLSTIFSLLVLTFIIKEIIQPKKFALSALIITILVLGFNYLVWLYAVVPEVFPLNTLIVMSIFYFAIRWYKTRANKYLYTTSFFIGLGITHHHTFFLVIPAVLYLFYKAKSKIRLTAKNIFVTAGSFLIGLLPLIYLVYVSVRQSEFQWGEANTLDGLIGMLTRRVYGTFVPGNFISNIPFHRFLQFKVLFLFTVSDFTILGLVLIALGSISYLRIEKGETKTLLTAVLINIIFFGPFYFFYANFPLTAKFLFGTLERFALVYYFFVAIFIYLGLIQVFNILDVFIISKLLYKKELRNLAIMLVPLIFLLYPAGLFIRNYRFVLPLKNDRTAENLGRDTLTNAKKNSLLLLSLDTILFDTQYIFYTYPQLRNDTVAIHLYKLVLPFYPKLLKKYYPRLNIRQNKEFTVSEFIKNNIKNSNIYANEIFQVQDLPDYEWIPQGLLYKLEKKKVHNLDEDIKNIDEFWKNSKNKDIVNQVKQNSYKFKNLSLADVLSFYAVAHKNTAVYLLDNNHVNDALSHIESSHILQPDDNDFYLLMSRFYNLKKQCKKAEIQIDEGFKKTKDQNYLAELSNVAINCYKNEQDYKRISKKIKNYIDELKTPINRY